MSEVICVQNSRPGDQDEAKRAKQELSLFKVALQHELPLLVHQQRMRYLCY